MSAHWHDCRRCSGQQQCNCDAPTEPLWLKAKQWAEARRKENAASQAWGRAEAAMLLANPWDPALKTAYVRARDEWTRANEALCEAEEALAMEVEQ